MKQTSSINQSQWAEVRNNKDIDPLNFNIQINIGGIVKKVTDSSGRKQSELSISNVLYRFNPVYKTYNSIVDNSILTIIPFK